MGPNGGGRGGEAGVRPRGAHGVRGATGVRGCGAWNRSAEVWNAEDMYFLQGYGWGIFKGL
jgi:hypothetical protein